MAFADIRIALDDIATFRREALPAMAKNILQMNTLTEAADAQIRKMEQGNKVAPSISLDVSEA